MDLNVILEGLGLSSSDLGYSGYIIGGLIMIGRLFFRNSIEREETTQAVINSNASVVNATLDLIKTQRDSEIKIQQGMLEQVTKLANATNAFVAIIDKRFLGLEGRLDKISSDVNELKGSMCKEVEV